MSFHIFHINEVYSNASGTVQYIEFVGEANSQNLWAEHSIVSTNGVNTNTFNILTNLPNSATLGKSVLVATQGFADLGLVTPDYIVPSGFVFLTGGNVDFPGMNDGTIAYAALPTNGTNSLDHDGVSGLNSPTNFAGASGFIPGNPIVGTAGANTLAGTAANDFMVGLGGDDTLTGGGGSDTLNGGAGDDVLRVTAGADVLDGGAGADAINFTATGVTYGGATAVTVNLATHVADLNSAAAGANTTLSSIETVIGTAGNDTFTGGDPAHAPAQENGEPEMFRPGGGNDTITGAAGHGWITIADYSTALSPVTVTLGNSNNLGTASGADIGTDTLVNVDRVRGGSGNDVLTGGSYATAANGNFNEHFRGNAGNDTINGQGSDTTLGSIGDNDIAEYQNSPFAVVVNLGTSDITGTPYGTVAAGTARDGWDSGGGGTDTLTGIDVVFGSANNDTLVAGGPDPNTNERLDGRAGNDSLVGGASGTDEADYGNDPAAVLVDLGLGTVTDGYGGTDTLVAINWTRGSDFDDTIVGGNNNNERLMGGRGDDSIDGGGTNGVSYAGYQIAVSGVNAFVENGSGTAGDGQGGTDTLANINGLWGGNFNDTLTGGLGDQWFRGRGGSDAIDGGGGIDTVVYRDPNPAGVTVNLDTNSATDGWGGAWNLQGTDTLLNIENVEGSDFNDNITGNAAANRLTGLGGNDVLNGGAGNDTMIGGGGNDTYFRNVAGDVVTELAGQGADTVRSSVTYTLPTNVENLVLIGIGNINGNGSSGNNVLTGNAGNNILDGKGGTDTLNGLGGNDTLVWASNDSYDGGVGTDVLKVLSGSLNLTTIANTRILNVETIDLTNASNNVLTLNTTDVLALSSTTNTLKVLGNAGDSINITNGFTDLGVVSGFHKYGFGGAVLLVDLDITNVA